MSKRSFWCLVIAVVLVGSMTVLDSPEKPATTVTVTPMPATSPAAPCRAFRHEMSCAAPTPSRAVRSRPLVASKPKPTIVLSKRPHSVRPASGLNWAALRFCESNGSGGYRANTGNGYYGAYQFDLRTWRGLGYSGYPHHASPATQDEAARQLYASRGRQPWPVCGRQL